MSEKLNVEVKSHHIDPTPDEWVQLKDQIDLLGIDLVNQLLTYQHIKKELSDNAVSQLPHITWQLIRHFVSTLATDHPNQIHFEIVEEALREIEDPIIKKESTNDHVAILATRLASACRKLSIYLNPPNALKGFDEQSKLIDTEYIAQSNNPHDKNGTALIVHEIPNLDESLFISDKIFYWDMQTVQFLSTLGIHGKKMADEIAHIMQANCNKYIESGIVNFDLWFNMHITSESKFYLSPILKLIVKILWEEEVKQHVDLRNSRAAITDKVGKSIMLLLSNKSATKESEDKAMITLEHEQAIIGYASIPLLDPKVMKSVSNGMKEFSSLTAHRMVRHYTQAAFNQAAQGIKDYRILRYDGGDAEIAERHLGLKGRSEITRVKEINTALNWFEFIGSNLTSKLISAGNFRSKKTGRNDGREIAVLSPLLPYRCFEDGGLLVPLLDEPALISRPATHAQQLLFHWRITEEFQIKSIDLYTNGFIEIQQEKFDEMSREANLNHKIQREVLERWKSDPSNPNTEKPKFLEHLGGDMYTLGKAHDKALLFLKEQGKRRLDQSIRSKRRSSK